jgi:D-serine deaminase-like pyridoxal phosphate-dependent protein
MFKRQTFNFCNLAFLVDKKVMTSNCVKMLELASKMNIKLRGQTKTHKTVEGAILQTGGTKR